MYNEEFKDFILTLFFFRTVRELGLLVASFDSWKYPLNMSIAVLEIKYLPWTDFRRRNRLLCMCCSGSVSSSLKCFA
jgi:hypothetical protein